MAKTPFKVTSNKMMTTSNQGKGVRGGAGDMAAALLLAANLSERQPLRLVPISAGVEQAERAIGLSNVSSPIWERKKYVCFQAYHGSCLRGVADGSHKLLLLRPRTCHRMEGRQSVEEW